MKKHVKYTSLLLAGSLLLTGCSAARAGGKSPESESAENTSAGAESAPAETEFVSADGAWRGKGGCYRQTDPGLGDSVMNVYEYEDKLFTLELIQESSSRSMTELRCGDTVLYSSESITGAAVASSGVWIASIHQDASGNRAEYVLLKLDFDGQELLRVDLTPYLVHSYLVAMQADKNGSLYTMLNDRVLVFTADGTPQGEIPLDNPQYLIAGGDGEVYAAADLENTRSDAGTSLGGAISGQRGNAVYRLDPASGQAESLERHSGYRVCSGNEDFLYTLADNNGLYGVVSPGDKPRPIALWAELSLSFQNIWRIQWMSGGKFLVQSASLTAVLEPAAPSEIKHRIPITIASVTSISSIPSYVASFNLNSEDYVVTVLDYSQNMALSTEDAITSLNMDLMSGKVPDLFDFSYLPGDYYVDKGLLADLNSLMDKEPDFGKEDFVLTDKLERDGKLYYVPHHYYLDTAAGLKSRFGDRYGWTLDEYLEIQSQYDGEIIYNLTREGFLEKCAGRYAAGAVDWENGTCDFDNDEFIKLLKTSAAVRENPEPEDPKDLNFTPSGVRLREGSLIVSMYYINNVRSLTEARMETGEALSFVGWPSPDGSGGVRVNADGLMGICSNGNQEGAWEFLKFVLTASADNPNEFGLPSYRKALEKQIENAMEDTGDGSSPATEEDARQLYDLMEHSVYIGMASTKVIDIIMEEAAPFLAGQKSAEDTARIIQSRVGLMAAEAY